MYVTMPRRRENGRAARKLNGIDSSYASSMGEEMEMFACSNAVKEEQRD